MYIIHSWAGIGVLIPFAALFLVGFIVWAGVQKENHARSLKHKEIMNAIDKGVDVPLVQSGNTPLDYLRKGIIWGVVGIVLILGFTIEGDFEAAGILGSVPFAIGVGYLVYYKYATKEDEK
tara:strand:- start:214 stop:576 length:363 start_codon:yes stop_codon:yes gene_type:complete